MILRCYSKENEIILLEFSPCRNNIDPQWEDWNYCADPLVVYDTDYTKLLLPYLNIVFPLVEPITGDLQERFDVCFDNWISKENWMKIIDAIKRDMDSFKENERFFYSKFCDWILNELKTVDIIVVWGNL